VLGPEFPNEIYAMDGMRHIAGALLILAVVSASAAAQPVPTSLSDLMMKPDRFDGHRVTVRGSISDFREHTTFGNSSYTFDLEDGPHSIRVFASRKPPCQAGPVLVNGTFQKQKAQRFILAANVTCHSQDSN
jgi:hypothetical protein